MIALAGIAIGLVWMPCLRLQEEPAPKNRPASELESRVADWIARLDDPELETRERAVAELLKIGKPAIPALKRAIADSKSPEVRARAERILDEVDWPDGGELVDDLRLTVRAGAVKCRVGSDLKLDVRLEHVGKAEKTLEIVSDGLLRDSSKGFRVVVRASGTPARGLGYFANLNRGPDRFELKIPAGSTLRETVTCYLGFKTGKGGSVEPLKAGTYAVAVMIGDEWGAGRRPTQACSNWIRIEVEPE